MQRIVQPSSSPPLEVWVKEVMPHLSLQAASKHFLIKRREILKGQALDIRIKAKSPWQEDVTKILSKLEGVHTFRLDAEQGSIQVVGNVEPEMLMNVLSKSTRNAEISKAYFAKDGFNQDLFSGDSTSFCPQCRSWHGQSCTTSCPNPNCCQSEGYMS